jgi:hypothetical protein
LEDVSFLGHGTCAFISHANETAGFHIR